MTKPSPNVQPVPNWWQLPFAMAVARPKLLPTHCYLCQIHPLVHANKSKSHTHWFNQLTFLCEHCHATLAWQQSQFPLEIVENNQITVINGVASSFYQFPYQQIIRDFKNSHQLDKLPLLIHAIRQLDKPAHCHAQNSVIVAVPTTIKRLTQRGFDPVTLLVQYLSFHWQIPVFTGIIREDRQKQQGLTREQRLTNTQNAFYFTELPRVPNVIVFDDVATTGATLQSLIDSLLNTQRNSPSNPAYIFHARAVAHG